MTCPAYFFGIYPNGATAEYTMENENTLIKVYQDISREVTLSGLSRKLIQLTNEQLNPDRVMLVIKSGDHYKILAELDKGELTIHQEAVMADTSTLPLQVFERLKRKPRTISITKTQMVVHFGEDEYLNTVKPFMVSLLPLVNQDVNVGFLLIENRTKEETFTPETLEYMELLAPQMAITLQNCVLNQSLMVQAQQAFSQQTEVAVKEAPKPVVTKQEKSIESLSESFEQQIATLGSIGQAITDATSVETIIETVYEKVNELMDAYAFDIGIFNKEKERIEFSGSIENGERLPFNYYSLSEENRLAVRCFKNSEEILISNYHKEYANYFGETELPAPNVGGDLLSVVYLPIRDKQETVGVITVQSKTENAYTNYHLNILRNLSVYVAIAIDNASLMEARLANAEKFAVQAKAHEQELKNAFETVKLLGEIGQDITANLSVDKIIETVYENVNNLMDAKIFSIGVYNSRKNRIDVPGTIEYDKKLPAYFYEISDDSKLSVYCLKRQEEVLIHDLDKDFNKYLDTQLPADTSGLPQSVIYMPLVGKVGPLGVITIQSNQKYAYGEQDLNILRNLAAYVGIALDNALVYESLEEIVDERTSEVVKQKEQIEVQHSKLEQSLKDVELLSDMGMELTSTLSTEDIISTMYEHVNNLMDASAFGVGIINPIKNHIEFRGALEAGEKLPTFYHPMDDDHRFSVWSIKNHKEVFILDYEREYNKYIEEMKAPEAGKSPESIIYLPLETKDKVIGVITVQSFKKNAYTPYHINILRNLAVYTAIAVENAESYHKMELQNQEIQKTSQKMTSSIKYAKRIQQAMLPNRTLINDLLADSFVFFKPRDIVSGDFFWFLKKGSKLFMAAVDCTGHGVPGAFMSIIGNNLLNEIVNVRDIESPDEVLNLMHDRVHKQLNQSETENQDGMDLALCVINYDTRQVEYAGAKNPLVRIVDGEMEVIKGDRMPIGGRRSDRYESESYTKHTFSLDDNAAYYIFSDGYADQFNQEGSKFLMKNFKEMLLEIHDQPMDSQRKVLRRKLMNWMEGVSQQTDDILVIGFRP
ncbi:GAF domain-containing protein [Limibacter armeniacum]|uniref:GAF domain-containing protein n=1 Tax=Limibacter armeniacum TaxID=466084 RepID=UPI002FE65805